VKEYPVSGELRRKLEQLLYGRKCWVCGARLKTNEDTLCRYGVHRNAVPREREDVT